MASIVKSFMGSPAVAAVAEVKIEGKPYVAAKPAVSAVEAGYTICLSQTELDWVVSALGLNNSYSGNSACTLGLFTKLDHYASLGRKRAHIADAGSICIPA